MSNDTKKSKSLLDNHPGSLELIQKNKNFFDGGASIDSTTTLINPIQQPFHSKRKCYLRGAVIGFPFGVLFLLIGAIMCANAFHGETSFGIKNIGFEKRLSISLMAVGLVLMIFAIACTVLYNKLPELVDVSVMHKRSYATIDKDNTHYNEAIDPTKQLI